MIIDVKTDFKNDLMKLPEYKHDGDAAMDVRANLLKRLNIRSGETVTVPTGLYVKIPDNRPPTMSWTLVVTPRSGLAKTSQLTILNSPGLIDSTYQGEIMVILHNSGYKETYIDPGDRFAQIGLLPFYKVQWNPVEEFSHTTARGTGGLGHTGVK